MAGFVRIEGWIPAGDLISVALGEDVYEPPTALTDHPVEFLMVQAQGKDVYYTLDGTTPDPAATPPKGFQIVAGAQPFPIDLGPGVSPKFKRKEAGAYLQIQPGKDHPRR